MKFFHCKSCGLPYREDEGHSKTTVRGSGTDSKLVSYADPPYNWSAANGYCLTCWLVSPDPPSPANRAESSNYEQN